MDIMLKLRDKSPCQHKYNRSYNKASSSEWCPYNPLWALASSKIFQYLYVPSNTNYSKNYQESFNTSDASKKFIRVIKKYEFTIFDYLLCKCLPINDHYYEAEIVELSSDLIQTDKISTTEQKTQTRNVKWDPRVTVIHIDTGNQKNTEIDSEEEIQTEIDSEERITYVSTGAIPKIPKVPAKRKPQAKHHSPSNSLSRNHFGTLTYPNSHTERRNSHIERKTWQQIICRERRNIMTPVTDQERKIIIEFCHLLEKSKQLFNGLRELPPYGHKQWHVHFGRTFDIYSKLWKYQQQHRLLLDTRYGLKRWQIGEVASKIGQLYYHYYLRTSDTTYLVESYSFYSAIRGRHYYHLASKEIRCELMVKKLRFYARFIVVAILLQQPVIIDELVSELDKQVVAYGHVYDPNDQAEWFNVLAEVKAFLDAEPGVTVIDPIDRNRVVTISGRINNLTVPPMERTTQMYLTLQDAIIIGSGTQLVKFSELTIDMFRMVQNLEWEIHVPSRNPSGGSPKDKQRGDSAACEPLKSAAQYRGVMDEDETRHVNPHKFLLFKPSANQVLIYLASCCNDLPPNGALLIYISANGHNLQQNKHVEDYGYDIGGVITSSKSDIYREYNKEVKGPTPKGKEPQILYPGDLHPFTRKPLFIIVDSDNSYSYQHIPRIFGQPLVILMSPVSIPSTLIDKKNQGSIFTLFLHNPIAGLCNSCDVYTIDLTTWQRCVQLRDTFMKEAIKLLMRIRIDPMFYAFMGDIHLRLILLRYIFCECALRMHKSFRSRTNLPRSVPPLPEELFMQEILVAKVLSMTELIGIKNCFFDPLAAGPSNTD